MRLINSSHWKLSAFYAAFLCHVVGGTAPAAVIYWDPNGTNALPNAPQSFTWSIGSLQWSTSSALSGSLVAWNTGDGACFCAGSFTNQITITVTNAISLPGLFNGPLNPPGCFLTIAGSGSLNFIAGQDGLDTAGSDRGTTTIAVPITGPGQIFLEGNAPLYLNATNTYYGGTELGYPPNAPQWFNGIVFFNNGSAFGTGPIVMGATTAGCAMALEGSSAVTISNPVAATNFALNLVGNPAGLTFSGPWSLGTNTPILGSGGTNNNVIISGIISGSGGLTRGLNNGSALTLTAINTYTGPTTITEGTLALSGNGSISDSSSLNIGPGGTFDVSGLNSSIYVLGSGASLIASGSGANGSTNAAVINGVAGGVVNLGSSPIFLNFSPTSFTGDTAHPSLWISQGGLALNNNVVTVTNLAGSALGAGLYTLVQVGNGLSPIIYGLPGQPVSVLGAGLAAGTTAYLSVSNGNLNLIVAVNLLTDPGFEEQVLAPNPNTNGVAGWGNFGSFFSTNYSHSGNWSLYTPDYGGGYIVPGSYQTFPASPGETFTLSGWVYTPFLLGTNSNDFAILQLAFYTGAPPNDYAEGATTGTFGVNVGQPAGGGGIPLPPGVWTYASVTGTAPPGTASLGAYLLDIDADANADFYFDDISLTMVPWGFPVITNEPASLVLSVGSQAVFTVGASGASPLEYQWQLDGTNLTNSAQVSGAQSNTLIISNILVLNSGNYQVVVTNSSGSVTSAVAALTVNMAQPVLTWNNPAAIPYGSSLGSNQLNATASVAGSFAYSPVSGAVPNAGTNLLSVTFTPADTSDYTKATGSVSLVVLRAALSVTASNASRAYGQTNPVFTGSVIGLTNGDPISATYTCSATPASPPGNYPIVPVLNDPSNRLGNYALTLTDGTLSISGLPLAHRYSFKDPPGSSSFVDAIGGANGSLNNSRATNSNSASLDGKELRLDGTGGYAVLPSGLLSSNSQVTIEFWASYNANGVWTRTFAFGSQTNGVEYSGLDFCHYAGLNYENLNEQTNNTGAFTSLNNPGGLDGQTNVHVTVVADPVNGQIYYYNGAVLKSLAPGGTGIVFPLNRLNDAEAWLGRSFYDVDPPLNGSLSEFRIYSGVLPPAQVALNDATGPSNYLSSPGTLNTVRLSTPASVLPINGSLQLSFTGNFSSVTNLNLIAYGGASFSSSNTSVLTVSSGGLVHAVGVGTTLITAVFASQSASVMITVSSAELLAHRYSFNDLAGSTNFVDSVGGANGSLNNSGSTNANSASLNGSQLRLDGTGGYGVLPSGLVSTNSQVTIEFWASYNSNAVWTRTFAFGNQSGGAEYSGLDFCHYAGGNFENLNEATTPTGSFTYVNNTPGLDGQTNVHVTVVVDPVNDQMYYYNGLALVSSGLQGAAGAVLPLNQLVDTYGLLGRSLYNVDPTLNGSLNEFRIYSGVLDAAQVALNDAAGPDQYLVAPGSLSALHLRAASLTLYVNSSLQLAFTGDFVNVSNLNLLAYGGATFKSSNSAVMSVSPSGLVHALSPGTTTVTATYVDGAGSGSNVALTFTAIKATPFISWANPANIIYGTALGPSQLNASANVPGNFSYTPSAGSVLNAGTNTLTAIFTATDTNGFLNVTNTVQLVVLHEPLTVTANSTSRAYGQTNPVFTGSVIGLTNGDPISATYTCSATPASPPGNYPIVPVLNDPSNRLENYTVTINEGTLVVSFPPTINVQPTSQILLAGSNATLTAAVSGASPLSLQWLFNGIALPGATNASLVLPLVQLSNAGTYQLLVTNIYGATNSLNAFLSVVTPPSSLNLAAGGRGAFVTTVSGTGPLAYQWKYNGNPIALATNSLLVLTNVGTSNAGVYSVTVSNSAGTVLASANLGVTAGNLVLYQTNLVVVRIGDGSETLSTAGNSTFLDQFTTSGAYVNTVSLPDSGPNGVVSSGDSFEENFLTRSLDGRLLCLAVYGTNLNYGNYASNTNLDTSSAALVPRVVVTLDAISGFSRAVVSPQFSGQPWRCAATDGTNNFWGVAGGDGLIYLGDNGVLATVQTNKANCRVVNIFNGNLYFASSSFGGDSNRGVYQLTGLPESYVGATNGPIVGSTNSIFPTDFAVNPAGTILYLLDDEGGGIQRWTLGTNQWVLNYNLTAGSSYTNFNSLAVDWNQTKPVLYVTTTPQTGASDQNQLLSTTDSGPGSSLTLLASSGPNQIFRGVKFGPLPTPTGFLSQPQNLVVASGATANFSVIANGLGALSYQWQFDGNNLANGGQISGAQSSALTISNANPTDAGNYQVIVSNVFGSVTSSVASLVLEPAITWTSPLPIVYGTSLSAAQLDATANVPGTFAYSPPAGTSLNAGTNLLTVVFTPSNPVNFTSATNSVSFVVARAPLAATANNAGRIYGQPNPIFTGTIAGLVNGDPITASYVCSATQTSPPGIYPIVPVLNDPNNRLGNYIVTINDGALTVEPCPLIGIYPQTLPGGIAGVAYNVSLSASNGAAPYTFNLVAGALPSGFNLSSSGVISGTSLSAVTNSFTVMVRDGNGCSGTENYILGVAATALAVNGTLKAAYGPPLVTQTINTGFGKSTVGDGTSTGGSELDAAYGTEIGGTLYLFLAGNLEDNGNHMNVFIDDGRAGQGTLTAPCCNLANMDGSVFSPGFNATYVLDVSDYQGTLYVESYDLVTNTYSYLGSIPLTGGIGAATLGELAIAFNDRNTNGVNGDTGTAANQAAADSVNTGLELAIPLSILGSPTQSVAVMADINGVPDNFLSDQFLPGLPVGTQDLGATNAYSGPEPGAFNLSSLSNLWFTISFAAPVITSEPQDVLWPSGAPASFNVSASGTEPLSYQWFFDATNLLEGATNSALVISNIQPVNAGLYSVLVSNAYGSVISSNAMLTLGPPGDYWMNPAGGNWSVAANWLANMVPAAGDNVYIVQSGTYAVSQDVNAVLNTLTLGAANDQSVNLIVQTNLQLIVTNATQTGLVEVGAGGSLTLQGAYLELDNLILTNGGSLTNLSGTIVYTKAYQLQNGGTVSISGGSINTATNFTISGTTNSSGALVVNNGGSLTVSNATLGVGNNGSDTNGSGSGSVTISNATLQAETITLGSSAGGLGTLTVQSNATVTVSSNITVVSSSKAIPSVVTITGGSLNLTNPDSVVQVGLLGSGAMTISGGQHVINRISLGSTNGAGTGGFYGLGGHLQVLSKLSANIFVMDGIDIDGSGGSITVAESAYNVAEFDVYAGTLTNWASMDIGLVQYGEGVAGIYDQSGGNVTITNDVLVGDDGNVDAIGQLTLKGGSLYITNQNHTGTLNIRNGSVDLNGGTLVVDILIMTNSLGTFQNNGGILSFGQLITSTGSYILTNQVLQEGLELQSGATAIFTNNVSVGNNCAAGPNGDVGRLVLQGGSFYVTNAAHTAVLDVRNGAVVLNSGTLMVDTLVLTNSCGQFENNGGVLSFRQLIMTNGPGSLSSNFVLNCNCTNVLGHGQLTSVSTLDIIRGTLVVSNGASIVAAHLLITNALGHLRKEGGVVVAEQVMLPPDLDADGDGQSNTNEILAGTDPLDPNSLFQFVTSQPAANGQDMVLSWTSQPFESYVVQDATNAPDGTISPFVDLSAGIPALGLSPSTNSFTDFGAFILYPTRYYRVRLGP